MDFTHYVNTCSATCHNKHMDLVEQRTLGIELGNANLGSLQWQSTCKTALEQRTAADQNGNERVVGQLQNRTPKRSTVRLDTGPFWNLALHQMWGFQTGVLDTLLSWSYICLCMVARPQFVLKFITLSRCTFFHTIWRTTRHIAKFVLKITSQTPGNKVP